MTGITLEWLGVSNYGPASPAPPRFPTHAEVDKASTIAAIASYIRTQWGNHAPAVKPADVAKIRDEIKDHSQSFTADELLQVQ